MPYLSADASSSSFLLAKCGSTLFCFGRSVLLWLVVAAFAIVGALSRRFALARRLPRGDKKS
jgi:hypothetical protein